MDELQEQLGISVDDKSKSSDDDDDDDDDEGKAKKLSKQGLTMFYRLLFIVFLNLNDAERLKLFARFKVEHARVNRRKIDAPVLRTLTLTVPRGSLVAVVGKVMFVG